MKLQTYAVKTEGRLDQFLHSELNKIFSETLLSNSKIRRLIFSGAVSVNKHQCRNPSLVLKKTDTVTLCLDEEKLFFEKKIDDVNFTLTQKDVLFEDDYIILVNKPAFFPTEATVVQSRDNLHAKVIEYLWKKNPSLKNPPYVGIMHRLDRETSGVILFTKQRSVNAKIFEMFEKHKAQKVYRAVSTKTQKNKDAPELKKGQSVLIKNFIGRISPLSSACKMGIVVPKPNCFYTNKKYIPEEAQTKITLFEEKDGKFYFEACPLTGRTHQIRVELAWCGFPILGDKNYNGVSSSRTFLHAQSLTFTHPVSGQTLTVEAELPQGFEP
jgi:23S rRNA pseudouridine1911/1915/1917 synthase